MRVDQGNHSSTSDNSTSKSSKKKIIHNVVVLDASGSMESCDKYKNAVRGIVKEMEELLKETEVEYTQTIIELSSVLKNNRQDYGIRKPLKDYTFEGVGASGGTPLYEVVGETIEEFVRSKAKDDVVLLKIFTDGQENSSNGKWSGYRNGGKLLAKLIEDVKEKHNFTVVFMGTEADVDHMIKNMNVDIGDTMFHDNTGEGVADTMEYMTQYSALYAKDISRGSSVQSLKGKFFKDKK